MARGRFNFYLNFQKDDELLVAERIDDLKRRRSFTSVVREGIIIISELREGRVDTLLRLYPWIVDAIKPAPPPSSDGDLKNEISLLRKLLMEQGAIKEPPAGYPLMKPSGYVPAIAAPVAVIAAAKVASADEICDNFMAFLQ